MAVVTCRCGAASVLPAVLWGSAVALSNSLPCFRKVRFDRPPHYFGYWRASPGSMGFEPLDLC